MKHRMSAREVLALAGIFLTLSFSGCGGDGGGTDVLPVVEQLAAGWERFRAGNYAGAIEKFGEAVRTDPSLGDGHNGLGWSYLRLDSLDTALAEFQIAVAKGFVGADAQAGRCLILNRKDEYRQAVFAGDAVLALDPTFELEADGTVDVRDVRLAMAQSYFALGEYTNAFEQLVVIDPAVTARVDPNRAGFLDALITEIENLTASLTTS